MPFNEVYPTISAHPVWRRRSVEQGLSRFTTHTQFDRRCLIPSRKLLSRMMKWRNTVGKCVIAVHRRALARHDQVRGTRLAYRYRRALYCESDHHLPAHCMGGSIGPATGGCVRKGMLMWFSHCESREPTTWASEPRECLGAGGLGSWWPRGCPRGRAAGDRSHMDMCSRVNVGDRG